MLRVSSRQIIKEAGPKEKKRARGINFDHVKNLLSQDGSEVSKQAIDEALADEKNLVINIDKLNWIESLDLDHEAKSGRLSEHESYLLIIGSAITSNSLEEAKSKLSKLNTYFITNHQIRAGSFELNLADLFDTEKIKVLFDEKFNLAEKWEKESEQRAGQSKGTVYLSNEVVHDFGDGWKVVYVPAAGEIEPFPGFENTSHDRILEGNKNGLCLGSQLKYYQDNDSGKIYSVRDPENKPRVTIRIQNNELEEAKGKNNNTPDPEGAEHAVRWFKSVAKLNYKDNYDYKKFPPTNIDDARRIFNMDSNIPYREGWISSWYKKGIPELDDHVLEYVFKKDPILFQSGLGKTHLELVKPSVIEACKKYLNNDSYAEVLFGEPFYPPVHEVFKTYKSLPEMVLAVKKLSEEEPIRFFNIGLQEYPEYREFSDLPIRAFLSKHPSTFLSEYSDKDWAKPYLDEAVKNLFDKDKTAIILHRHKEWAQPYVELAAKSLIEEDPVSLLPSHKEEWMKPYLDRAAKNAFEKDPVNLLYYLQEDWAAPYVSGAAGGFAKVNPIGFIVNFGQDETVPYWAAPYLDDAINNAIEENPVSLIWMRGTKELNLKDSDYESAIKNAIEKYPAKFIYYFQYQEDFNSQVELAKLNIINKIKNSTITEEEKDSLCPDLINTRFFNEARDDLGGESISRSFDFCYREDKWDDDWDEDDNQEDDNKDFILKKENYVKNYNPHIVRLAKVLLDLKYQTEAETLWKMAVSVVIGQI
jgi:hypothetical protein